MPRAMKHHPWLALHRNNARCFCLTLDLKDDPALVAKYRKYH